MLLATHRLSLLGSGTIRINTMTKSEKACRDMADVCRLAHMRTVRECARLQIPVDCTDTECEEYDEEEPHYWHAEGITPNAQGIFDRHRDHICEGTGI